MVDCDFAAMIYPTDRSRGTFDTPASSTSASSKPPSSTHVASVPSWGTTLLSRRLQAHPPNGSVAIVIQLGFQSNSLGRVDHGRVPQRVDQVEVSRKVTRSRTRTRTLRPLPVPTIKKTQTRVSHYCKHAKRLEIGPASGTAFGGCSIRSCTVMTVRPESLDFASVLGIFEPVRFALAAFVANLFVRQTAPFAVRPRLCPLLLTRLWNLPLLLFLLLLLFDVMVAVGPKLNRPHRRDPHCLLPRPFLPWT